MHSEVKNVFDKKFYEIIYNEELDIIETNWYGYSSLNDLKNALQVGLAFHADVKCAYKLNDNTLFNGPWADAVEWLTQEWLPNAMKTGLRYLAHVATPSSFGELAGEAMQLSAIGQQLYYRMFYSKKEAIEWLLACQQQEAVLNE